MLKHLLLITEEPDYYDATDAVAVAVCHHYQSTSPIGKNQKGFNGWEDYLKRNPKKIAGK